MTTIRDTRKEFMNLQQITKELRTIGFIAYIEINNTTELFTLRVKNNNVLYRKRIKNIY